MPREKTITVFKLSELKGKARERALEKLGRWATKGDWWEYTYRDATEIGKLLGIEIDDISFSGFWSQGDGASFVGTYAYVADAVASVAAHTSNTDAELVSIAQMLSDIQAAHGNVLSARIHRTSHRSSHEYTVGIEVFKEGDYSDEVSAETEKALLEVFRRFMRWIYKALEEEHTYLTSEEQLLETADANDYEFHADGSLA